jgi:hypothetical protein
MSLGKLIGIILKSIECASSRTPKAVRLSSYMKSPRVTLWRLEIGNFPTWPRLLDSINYLCVRLLNLLWVNLPLSMVDLYNFALTIKYLALRFLKCLASTRSRIKIIV